MDTQPRQDDPRHLPIEFSDPETPSTDSHTGDLREMCPSDRNTTSSKHTHTHTHTHALRVGTPPPANTHTCPSFKNTTTSKHTHTHTHEHTHTDTPGKVRRKKKG